MKLIVGLGNPGEKYKNNRHNVGHFVVDELIKRETKKLKNIKVTKTNSYMNQSGEFVKKLVDQYKVNMADLWVISDDLDIRLGDYKIQFAKGPKDHHGLASINNKLGTNDYWHVRIGIDNRESDNRTNGETYVLQDFSGKEKGVVKKVVDEVTSDLLERMKSKE